MPQNETLKSVKIKSIDLIKNYKSFVNYKWTDFLAANNQKFSDFNIIFGSNGSGKSSVTNIFKSSFLG